VRRVSKRSALIGVTIWNKAGFSVTVRQAASSLRTEVGTGGKGSANSVEVAEGEVDRVCLDQRKPRAHLGHSHQRFVVSFGRLALFRASTVPSGMPECGWPVTVPQGVNVPSRVFCVFHLPCALSTMNEGTSSDVLVQ
jgi:hypothetical protein